MKTYKLAILTLVINLAAFAQAQITSPLSVSLNEELIKTPIVEGVLEMLKERDLVDPKAED